jgi:hypothetical protein
MADGVIHAPVAYCYDGEMELTLGIWVNPRLPGTSRRQGMIRKKVKRLSETPKQEAQAR